MSESSRRSSFHGTGTKPSPGRRRLSPPSSEAQLTDRAGALRAKPNPPTLHRRSLPSPSPTEGLRPGSSNSDKEKRSDTATKVHFSQPIESTVERDYTDISFPVPDPPATEAEPNPLKSKGILPMTQADTTQLATIHEPHHDTVRDLEKADDIPRGIVNPLQYDPDSKIEPCLHTTAPQERNQVASESAQTHRTSGPSSPVTSVQGSALGRVAASRGPTTEERATVEMVSASPGNLSNVQNQSGHWSRPADNESVLACDCSRDLKLLQGHFGLLRRLPILDRRTLLMNCRSSTRVF
jgi:hypothetical protein